MQKKSQNNCQKNFEKLNEGILKKKSQTMSEVFPIKKNNVAPKAIVKGIFWIFKLENIAKALLLQFL